MTVHRQLHTGNLWTVCGVGSGQGGASELRIIHPVSAMVRGRRRLPRNPLPLQKNSEIANAWRKHRSGLYDKTSGRRLDRPELLSQSSSNIMVGSIVDVIDAKTHRILNDWTTSYEDENNRWQSIAIWAERMIREQFERDNLSRAPIPNKQRMPRRINFKRSRLRRDEKLKQVPILLNM